jgi:Fatty acid hydroxylase superfamily
MGLLSFEHGRTAYRADFVVYATVVTGLSVLLLALSPSGRGVALLASLLAGLLAWSLIEYGLHRFVLHGLAPFCTPTLLSGALVGLFVFLPAALLGDRWLACALTLGLLLGYLAYAVTHHAIHHWQNDSAWLRRRRLWHALHHRRGGGASCFGVTGEFWDRRLGTAATGAVVRQRTDESAAAAYKHSATDTQH